MRTIVTAALQRQYSQTELIFWITLVVLVNAAIPFRFRIKLTHVFSHIPYFCNMFRPSFPLLLKNPQTV
jgi:hypothetical protein